MRHQSAFRKIITTIRDDLNPATERGRLVRATLGGTFLKVASALLALIASMFYARILGPHGYGLYAYVVAVTSIVTIVASCGLPGYTVREGAQMTGGLGALRSYADRHILIAGLAATCVLAAIAMGLSATEKKLPLLIAAAIPFIANLSAVRQSLLQVHGRIAQSLLPSLIVTPLATFIAALGIWITMGSLSAPLLVIATLAGSVLALIVAQLQWSGVRNTSEDRDYSGTIFSLRHALPFMWLSAMYLVMNRTDLIMLGVLATPYEAGVYAVSARSADLLVFVGMAAVTAAAPQMARLHKANNNVQLQRLVSGMSSRLLITTVPAAAVMIIFSGHILGFLYGPSHSQGGDALKILAVAQLLSVLGGPLGTLLNMSGNEKLHMRAIFVGMGVNILLNILFIPPLGIEGAALATCISIVLSRAILIVCVRRKLNLKTTAFGV